MKRAIGTWAAACALLVGSQAQADEDATPVAALPGIDEVKPAAPDWCGSYRPQGEVTSRIHSVQRYVDNGEISEQVLRWIAQLACEQPNDPAMQKRVATWRQAYLNAVGVSEADDRAALKLRVDENRFDKQKRDFCRSLEPSSEASQSEKTVANARKVAFGCVDDAEYSALGWWIDRTSDADEMLRAQWVSHCLRFRFADRKDSWPDPKHPENQARFATCGADARRLDRGKLDALLAGADYNDYARATGHETWGQAKTTYAMLERAYRAMAAKDESWKRLFFDAPESGYTNWEKTYAAHRDEIDAALAFEDKARGPSRRAMNGCGPSLRQKLVAYVKSKGPQSFEQARTAMSDDVGGVLMSSMILCDAAEGRLVTAAQEFDQLQRNEKGDHVSLRDRRGPRLAAYYAVVEALSDILADRDRFPLQASQLIALEQPPREGDGDTLEHKAYDLWANKSNATEDEWGEVASVKKGGDGVVVTFKTVSWMADTYECHFTNHIWRIGPNGEVEYEQSCKITGKHKESKTEHPIVVGTEVADGIKVGAFGHFKADQFAASGDQPRPAFPVAVYNNKDKKKLVNALGVGL